MIEGKVCNALTSTLSSRKCYICGATPTEMKELEVSTRKETDVAVYICICLSTLHAWIQFFECLLHISYRLEVKKWQIRKQDREKVQQRKPLIQEKFCKEMGLLVDVPKPGGSGTTNDGNTTRQFFFFFFFFFLRFRRLRESTKHLFTDVPSSCKHFLPDI